jgi:GH18 family chitinase
MVSAFGEFDAPTTNGQDPVQLANTMAAFVKEYDFDGIDVDYEVGLASSFGLQCGVSDFLARTLLLSTL